MKRFVVCGLTMLAQAVLLSACQSPSSGCDSFLQAMRNGAIAGLEEGLTGQEQSNPYLSGNCAAAPQQQQVRQPAPAPPDPTALAARYGKKHAALIVQGHIDVGMTEEEVTLAWGDPAAKKPRGKRQKVWEYSGGDNVVFTRGKVSAVTHGAKAADAAAKRG